MIDYSARLVRELIRRTGLTLEQIARAQSHPIYAVGLGFIENVNTSHPHGIAASLCEPVPLGGLVSSVRHAHRMIASTN